MVTVTSDRFLHHCKLGTLQFVVCKPILSALDYAFSYTSLGGGALLDYSKPALWIILLLNLSVSIALTALLKFFHATHLSPRLRARRPWPKLVAASKSTVGFARARAPRRRRDPPPRNIHVAAAASPRPVCGISTRHAREDVLS